MIDENEGFDYQVMPREEERINRPIWQSYVYGPDGKCFFISTIERTFDIPAAGGSVRGLETIAWECDLKTKERGRMIFHGEGLMDHMNACRGLIKIGRLE